MTKKARLMKTSDPWKRARTIAARTPRAPRESPEEQKAEAPAVVQAQAPAVQAQTPAQEAPAVPDGAVIVMLPEQRPSTARKGSLFIRIREEDKAVLQKLAKKAKQPLASWCRSILEGIARQYGGKA